MPVLIICASPALCQFAQAFRHLFSKPQYEYLETVLLALMQVEGRRTLSEMQRAVAERLSVAGLSRFFAVSPWLEEEVAQHWQQRFHLQMQASVQQEHHRLRMRRPRRVGRPSATLVTGYLILDDSTHHKPKGKKMGGLGRHHSTTYDKRVSGHSLFQGLYVLLGRRCPLTPRMYRSKQVCQAGGHPFHSKVDLSVSCVEEFVPVEETHTHVLVDAWYMNKRLWKAAKQRGFDLSGGIANNRYLRVQAADGTRSWQSLAAWAVGLAPEAFEEVTWPSEAGGQKRYVHCVRTRIRKLGACQVLCVKDDPTDPPKKTRFFVCSLLQASAQQIVEHLAVRWDVETFFGDFKELFGSDHYQLMSERAIVRFWTLGCLAYVFVEEQRAQRDPSQTIGQTRRAIRSDNYNNLLDWIVEHSHNGGTLEQIRSRLAA